MKIQFNERELKRLMETEVQASIDKMAAEQNRELERLGQRYTGKPVEEIKPALQRLFARYDGRITEPNLTNWAQLISDGTRIAMKPERIRL